MHFCYPVPKRKSRIVRVDRFCAFRKDSQNGLVLIVIYAACNSDAMQFRRVFREGELLQI